MSTPTLIPFEVRTYASKADQRTIPVMAKDRAAAAAAAIAGHKAEANLPASASVLVQSIAEASIKAVAPTPMTKAEQARMAHLRRQGPGGNDAA